MSALAATLRLSSGKSPNQTQLFLSRDLTQLIIYGSRNGAAGVFDRHKGGLKLKENLKAGVAYDSLISYCSLNFPTKFSKKLQNTKCGLLRNISIWSIFIFLSRESSLVEEKSVE